MNFPIEIPKKRDHNVFGALAYAWGSHIFPLFALFISFSFCRGAPCVPIGKSLFFTQRGIVKLQQNRCVLIGKLTFHPFQDFQLLGVLIGNQIGSHGDGWRTYREVHLPPYLQFQNNLQFFF